jgi:putative membrane protein
MFGKYSITSGALLLTLAGSALADNTLDKSVDTTGEKFIKEAIQGNLAEVKVGQLAQEKGTNQGVIDYGAALAKDHERANQSAIHVAQQMSIIPPDEPDPRQQAEFKKLSAHTAEQFDRQFLKRMVKDHKEDISKYQKEAQQGGPAADYAKQTLPTLREHLKMAEDLERQKPAG